MALAGGVVFVVEANTVGYQAKMVAANRQLQQLGVTAGVVSKKTVAATTAMATGAARLEKAYLRVRTVMVSVGVSLATIAGLAVMGKLITAAIEFETAFAGVQKTVEATAPELEKLRNEIRQMAKEIPLTTTELSKIGEVGGQLGISVQNMGRFINVIAKLGVATTMSIDDAAMSLARFAAIMRTSEKDYERVASTLVHLGNNFAATEQEIMTMSLRIAGAGKQVGMTEDQVLSLATALTAVGIRAEAGGTAISRTMIEIDKQVAVAGDRLSQFAKVAGLGVTQFAQLWEKDAMAALQMFIEGLSRLEARGGNASIVLQELGLGAVRVSDTLRRASSAHELLNETLKYGADGWRENIALQREAEIRFATAASQFRLLANRINDLAISVGDHLAPVFLVLGKILTVLAEQTWAWKLALDLLLLKGFFVLVKRLSPLLLGVATSISAAAKATALWRGSLILSTAGLKAQLVALDAYLASIFASTMATNAATVATTRQAIGVAGLNATLTGNLAATRAATAASTQFGATATVAATATKGWVLALGKLGPILAVVASYFLVTWFVKWAKAQQAAADAVDELNKEVRKQAEALGMEATAVADTSEKVEALGSHFHLAAGGHRVFFKEINESQEDLAKAKEALEKISAELEILDTVLTTGVGTWEQYRTIITNSTAQGATYQELQRSLLRYITAEVAAGKDLNDVIGEHITSLRDLMFQSALAGEEHNRYGDVLHDIIKKFNEASYAISAMEKAYGDLKEEQKKIIDAFWDVQKPLSAYVKKWEEIAEINKEAKVDFISMSEYARQFSAQIIEAAEAQIRLGKPLKDTERDLYNLALRFESVNKTAQGFVKAFDAAINPSIEMGKKIRALQADGKDLSTIVRLYGDDILEAAAKTTRLNQKMDESTAAALKLAKMMQKPIDRIDAMKGSVEALIDEERIWNLQLNTLTTSNKKLTAAMDLDVINKMIAANKELGSVLPIKFVKQFDDATEKLFKNFKGAAGAVDALSDKLGKDLAEELVRLTQLPGVVAEKIAEMDAAGLNAAQQMHLFGGSIKEAAEWLILLDRPLTEAEQGIVDLAAAATDTSKIIQKQISTIITDLGKGFADIIVEWQGLWTSLKDIAKDFAKGILRIFFESLFTPIMKGFANVMGGVQGGFMGGFQGAGGFGGVTGIFKALGGLFTKTTTASTGFGGFTDAAEGMTMMDTAATSSSLSLTALTTNFKALGATISGAVGTMWEFLTVGIAGGPWGLVIAGAAAAAVILWKTVFSKSAYEKFAMEFARDFGDIVISDDAIKNFTNSLGVTEEQLAKVRKDVASSPAFLMIGYNAAVAQGKVEQFLTSLESIETAWGTFDFRAAFEEGLATGNWLDLNDAFVEAFGTDLLKDIFGDDLKGLLIEMDEELIKLILRTRELQGALETLRDEPVRVASALDIMTSSIQILRDAGATDAEVMKILGEDMKVVVAAAHELGIAIPPVIQELLALDLATTGVSEAFQEGYHMWGNIVDQGKNLSDTIMGLGARMLELFDVAEAQEMTWKMLGGDILSLANSYTELGIEIPPIIQLTLDWAVANGHAEKSADGLYTSIGKLSAAYQEGGNIWKNFLQDGKDLEQTLLGLGDALLETYDVATAQSMAWKFLGDDIVSLANSYEEMGVALPPVIQMALEWAEAAGYIERNAEGAWVAVEGLTGALNGLNEQQVKGLQAWEDTLTATQDLADFMEGWQLGAIGTLGLDLSNVDDQTRLALLSWNEFGAKAISDANEMISSGLGEFIDARTLQMLEWAKYMGLVTKTADGMWKAIEGPGAAMQKPYWLENWAAEMDSIYGPAWRNWQKYKAEWGGTGPGTAGTGEAPEFPFVDPDDYPISETAELSTRMGELHDVLRDLIGGIQLLADSLRGLGDGVRSAIFDPTAGLPSNPPSPLNPPGALPDPTGVFGPGIVAPPLGPGLPTLTDDSDDRPVVGRPGRKFGTDYVSQDMVALLHKGERVVPASENKAGGYPSSGTTVNITIQGPVYGLDDLDRKIANSVRKTFKAGGLSFLGDS